MTRTTNPRPSFDELSNELNARKRGFDWSFVDQGEKAVVQLGPTTTFALSLTEPLSADFTRKAHANGRTVEPSVCLCLQAVIELFNVETVLDIGAHYGFLSLFMAKQQPVNSVHSVEMNPDVVKILTANLDLNPDAKAKCTIHNIGVSDADHLAQDIWFHGMRLLFEEPANKGIPHTKLDILTFNSLIERVGQMPDLIKIDIEGFEAKLVSDLRTFDTTGKRPAIMLELHGEELLNRLGSTRKDIFDALFGQGYECAMLTWHQHMPASGLISEVTAENLDEKLAKPHGMYLFW